MRLHDIFTISPNPEHRLPRLARYLQAVFIVSNLRGNKLENLKLEVKLTSFQALTVKVSCGTAQKIGRAK